MDSKVGTGQARQDEVQGQIENYDDVVVGARKATENQKTMSFKVGIRRYPQAVAWSVLLSTAMWVLVALVVSRQG